MNLGIIGEWCEKLYRELDAAETEVQKSQLREDIEMLIEKREIIFINMCEQENEYGRTEYIDFLKSNSISCKLLLRLLGDRGDDELRNEFKKSNDETHIKFGLWHEVTK